jgi:cobalt/nickel transport system ATP-binding protein
MNALYRLTDVRFSYLQQIPAVRLDHLELLHNSRIALIGANGSGKSTLLKILDALYFPQSGTIEFDGTKLTEEAFANEQITFAFRKRVGFLFQDPEVQLFSPTVWDEICFGPLQLQWKKDQIRERAEQILDQFELQPLRDRPPYRLSVGEKKKVALASVLVLDPEVLLLDEPTAALDPRTQSVLLELLQEWAEQEKTIITSTHDLSILREICNEVYVLEDGAVVYHNTPEDVLQNQPLLERTNLVHVHTHRHRGFAHFHPHTHDFHGHIHEEKKEE